MKRALFIALSLLMCFGSGSAQTKKSPAPTKTLEEVDRFLAGSNLKDCQDRVVLLQGWIDTNSPIGQRLQAENEELRRDLRSSREDRLRNVLAFLAIGVGFFIAWGIVKGIVKVFRRWRPLSRQKRQLLTLLLIATWISIATLVAVNDRNLSDHPVNLALSVFVYSLPALAFGGIGVWWFGRTMPSTEVG